jgi:hypothetical protein
LVLAAVYIGLRPAFGREDVTVKKAIGVFAGGAGFLTTWFLYQNPALLHKYTGEIVVALIGVVLALIAFTRKGVG